MLAEELERIRDSIESLRKDLDSFIKSYNSNNTDSLQRLTSVERWQEAHEKLDEERWINVGKKLDSIHDMLEAIPLEIGKDLGVLEHVQHSMQERLTEHENIIQQMRGAWRVMIVSGSVLAALGGFVEFILHRK